MLNFGFLVEHLMSLCIKLFHTEQDSNSNSFTPDGMGFYAHVQAYSSKVSCW